MTFLQALNQERGKSSIDHPASIFHTVNFHCEEILLITTDPYRREAFEIPTSNLDESFKEGIMGSLIDALLAVGGEPEWIWSLCSDGSLQ